MKIIRKITSFIRIPLKDKLCLIEAICLDLIFRVLILTFPLKYYAKLLGKQGLATSENEIIFDENVKTVLRAARRAFRESRWNSKCFDKALTVKRMLKRRGIETTIYFGLSKEENNLLKAHAWLRYGDRIITGRAGMQKFTVVSFFS